MSARAGHDTVTTRRDGAVAIVELNRPETLNAFNATMARELRGVLEGIASDASTRAVVLTGSGRAFSSGFDLFAGGVPTLPSGRPDLRWALEELFNSLVLLLREMPQPVVAAVNGVAAGIGASYALACDLVVAARSASLLLAFVHVGLVPDGGSTVLVPARAGAGRALEMSLLGEPVGADRALEWGLVNRVADDDALLEEATALAQRLAGQPTAAQAAIKQLLGTTFLDQLRAQLQLEARVQGERGDSEESAAAVAAFAERRRAARAQRDAAP
jgi:2-(1,2-epoxy-1,2-dihydrophenyl)acetyl-CoA isomerase